MKLERLSFYSTGYCSQQAWTVGIKGKEKIRFHAIVLAFHHPLHGLHLIDTGYSRYNRTSDPFSKVYQSLLPTKLNPEGDIDTLIGQDFETQQVSGIFVSHWHPDHVGGLKCFPTPKIICRETHLNSLLQLGSFGKFRNGFMSHLIPENLESRIDTINETQFHAGKNELQEFRIHDYWNDGSLLIVDLPGHAAGHTGYILQTENERIFYVVDAFWNRNAFNNNANLPWISRSIQFDWDAYEDSQLKIRNYERKTGEQTIACHCPTTLKYVQRYPN